jgi:serine/threonine protein kinase
MLRCPKCSRIYQSGANRFCTYDGGRLISVSEASRSLENAGSAGDFNRSQTESPSDWQPRRQTGRLVLPPQIELSPNGFTAAPRFAENEASAAKTETINGFQPANVSSQPLLDKRPTGRLVLPADIPNSFAPVGDRSIRPTGRLPITAQSTSVLVGQNVKGRYTVDKVLQQDALTVTYLGHDRLGEYRQVLIKIWLDNFPPEAEETRRFYEERGALSHLNHPNIARILDAGDLTEGKPFVITEYPEGLTLSEAMQITGQFQTGRTARIVRQIAQALTEAHNNRLTHRNLKPENVVLKNDGTIEQVKVLNFGVAGDESDKTKSLAYVAPENMIGQLAHVEGDIFALGVVAFEMLTGRKPFAGATEDDLLDAEELGLSIKPSNLRLDLSPAVDTVLERALAFSRAERFHHAREFGESLFNALTESAAYKPAAKPLLQPQNVAAETIDEPVVTENPATEAQAVSQTPVAEIPVAKKVEAPKTAGTKTTVAKEKSKTGKAKWLVAAVCILTAIGIGTAFWYNRNLPKPANEQPYVFQQPAEAPQAVLPSEVPLEQPAGTAEVPVPQNLSTQGTAVSPNFTGFENSKANLDGKLAENYLPFSLAYPQNWERNPNAGKPGAANFLDVSNRLPNGLPLEQLIVSWYESKGSFKADRRSFPNLVKKLTAAYAKEIPDFRKVAENETKLNGRTAYEVKFAGNTKDEQGKTIKIFGRTIFVSPETNDSKSGLTLTMLATDLSPSISSVSELGKKGELKGVLESFELGSAAAPKQ